MMHRIRTKPRTTNPFRVPARSRGGFTVVELMVALAILTFGVYAIYDQFLASRDLGRRREADVRGRLLAERRLEELRAAPYDELAALARAGAGASGAGFAAIPDSPGFYVAATVAGAAAGDGSLEIAVTVGRESRRGSGAMEFSQENLVTVRGVRTP